MSVTLAQSGEFGLLERIQRLLEEESRGAFKPTVGIGDDTAAFAPRAGFELLLTCDCMVEGRHFSFAHMTPMEIGRRAMVMNISDIGAMGGAPLCAVVSLGLRAGTSVADVEAIYRGFLAELNPLGVGIVGGNLAGSGDGLFINVTMLGEVEKDLLVKRSGARLGDVILVTGYPGQAAAGLQIMLTAYQGGKSGRDSLVRAYTRPGHRAREGRAVAQSRCATSMIDISDGLWGDLGHICRASGTGAVLEQERLPISTALREAAVRWGSDPHELVLRESDDYELLITCAPEDAVRLCSAINACSRVPVNAIGNITDPEKDIMLRLPDGSCYSPNTTGWNHFTR
jgi:thiamine-monophosphate kinase